MDKAQLGSLTAKDGFLNEENICDKFNSWSTDEDAKQWLSIMGYNPHEISHINAVRIPVQVSQQKIKELGLLCEKYEDSTKHKKADIQVQLKRQIDDSLYIENISLKKSNKSAGFNQIDKRPVSTYKRMWNFDNEIEMWLKLFTGENLPKNFVNSNQLTSIKDQRRLFFTEMPDSIVNKIVIF